MTSLERPNGTAVTKAGVAKTTETITYVVLQEDLNIRRPFGQFDTNPRGDKVTIFCKAGHRLTQSAFDRLFLEPDVQVINPQAGKAGDKVQVTGTNLDGVTGVTVGGVAATAVIVVSSTLVEFTVPAHAAGVVDIVLTDDAGAHTITGGFTYTA